MDKTSTRTLQLLKTLRVIAWIAYFGFSIEAGAILFAFIISWYHPSVAGHLYWGKDLQELSHFNTVHYVITVLLTVLLPMLKATVTYQLIKVMTVIKLADPFTSKVAQMLVWISSMLLMIWIVEALSFTHDQWVLKLMGRPLVGELGGESLLIAGLVFVIAQIFKRGVEIQSENELTV